MVIIPKICGIRQQADQGRRMWLNDKVMDKSGSIWNNKKS